MLIQNNYEPQIVKDKNSKPNLFYGRIKVFILAICILFIIFILHLVNMLKNNDFWKKQVNDIIIRKSIIPAKRGRILDRNGNVLAADKTVYNVIIDTYKLKNFNDLRTKNPSKKNNIDQQEKDFNLQLINLANILNIPENDIFEKIKKKKYGDIYLRREVDKNINDKIESLNILALKKESYYIRKYPRSSLFAQIVGISKLDLVNNKEKIIGLEGIEYYRNNDLEGHNGMQVMIKDNNGNYIKKLEDVQNKDPVDGKDILLSFDKEIQEVVYNHLSEAINYHNAKGGSVIVLDSETGEILSMLSYPSYDPENFKSYNSEFRKNKSVVDLIEPGSTIKPFIVSAALNEGLIKPDEVFDTKPYKIGKHKIKDVHNYDSLSVTDIIKKSSNVGASHIGFKLLPKDLYNYLKKYGLVSKPNSGLPGEANPILKDWNKWSESDHATLSYGYSISVSLLQLARAYTVFFNDGKLLPVTILKNGNKKIDGTRVISSKTALEIKKMLLSVTERGGTGVKASINGYDVAGKTGTTQKNYNHQYLHNSHISLFIGGIHVKKGINLIVAISIDSPKENGYYGGEVAAPIFSKIAQDIVKLRNYSFY